MVVEFDEATDNRRAGFTRLTREKRLKWHLAY